VIHPDNPVSLRAVTIDPKAMLVGSWLMAARCSLLRALSRGAAAAPNCSTA
jgi:hypothetical protein